MATQVTLKAELREGRGKGMARRLRAAGQLPAVVYGADEEALSITLNAHDAIHLFHSISVENTIINLQLKGKRAPVPSLVREIQTHPARSNVLHVDFLRIQSGVAVELEVPVHLEGVPEGVRLEGGVLEQSIHEIPISCLPKDIPEVFNVDVTALQIGDAVRIEDVAAFEGVEILIDLDRTICTVQPPTALVVEEEEEEEGEIEGEEAIDKGAATEESEDTDG